MVEKIKTKQKSKLDKKNLITRVMALILVLLTLIASCSTFIYYLVSEV